MKVAALGVVISLLLPLPGLAAACKKRHPKYNFTNCPLAVGRGVKGPSSGSGKKYLDVKIKVLRTDEATGAVTLRLKAIKKSRKIRICDGYILKKIPPDPVTGQWHKVIPVKLNRHLQAVVTASGSFSVGVRGRLKK